jgi:low molecular weight phosphotyrosine protein phosphatase
MLGKHLYGCPSSAILRIANFLVGRSTMAEGVFQSLTRAPLAQNHAFVAKIDSCGTGAYHVGDSPDRRTMATLKQNGITSYRHAARKFAPSTDFADFDFIFAMDDQNLEDLMDLRTRYVKKHGEEGVGKVMLFGEFGGKKRKGGAGGEEVQDPYYGANDGFVVAHEQCLRFSKAFLESLERGELS